MRRHRLAVDRGDEDALMACTEHPFLPSCAQEMREAGSYPRAFGLIGWKKDEQVGIIAAKPGDKLSVAKDHLCIGCTRENTWSGFRVIVHRGKVGPAQDGAVRIGWIRGCQLHELRLLSSWLAAQLAKQIDSRRQRELRCAKTCDEVAASDAAALFECLEHIVDGAETT